MWKMVSVAWEVILPNILQEVGERIKQDFLNQYLVFFVNRSVTCEYAYITSKVQNCDISVISQF
jgi:hypothetical protein